MERYLKYLLLDITASIENVPKMPMPAARYSFADWVPEEEENRLAPRRILDVYTGVSKDDLPSEAMLTTAQLSTLLNALKALLDAYNWMFVMQFEVPERIQYETIRQNFDQEMLVKRWHMGFFNFCFAEQAHKTCTLGEYCHCAVFADMFSHFDEDEELSP